MNATYPPEPCLCGASDCPRCFPGSWKREVTERNRERAMDELIEVVMNFGQYPQPLSVGTFFTTGSRKPKEFDLYEFLEEEIGSPEFSDLLEYFILSLNDHSTIGSFADSRSRWEKRVEKMLRNHFDNSALLERLAEKDLEEEE